MHCMGHPTLQKYPLANLKPWMRDLAMCISIWWAEFIHYIGTVSFFHKRLNLFDSFKLHLASVTFLQTRSCAPDSITTDHGSHFKSQIFPLDSALGGERIRTIFYHLAATPEGEGAQRLPNARS